MVFSNIKGLLLTLAASQAVQAHTTFTNFFVNGADQGDGVCVRMSNIPSQATFPISSVSSPDMACGVNGETSVARVCPVNDGATLTFEFRTWPDASQPGSIDASHKGPCAVYMKKVDSAMANNTAAGDGWFKIWDEGYDESTNQWCTEKLIANDGHLSVALPADVAGGYYLVRPELLALQQADKNPSDPQFASSLPCVYVGCAQIFYESTGSAIPGNTVSIPGYVDASSPALTFNIYNQPMALPYPSFGPPAYESTSSSKRDLSARQSTQTEGLMPANCVLVNANWCGIELASYSDENGCWAASTACWDQCTDCYDSAPPTGSKNCPIWEAKCTAIQDACSAGNYNGPPNAGQNLTPALSSSQSLPPATAMTGSVEDSSFPQSSTVATATTTSTPTSSSTPAPSPSFSSGAGTSIDTCGSDNGGLVLAIAVILVITVIPAVNQASAPAQAVAPSACIDMLEGISFSILSNGC
ncbi:MAG: hypothetical protein M1827_002440 [Pycnora praestabilis]|nr:MAG: hypothetical protein M1827_002440 [Pycnora praestabilis]